MNKKLILLLLLIVFRTDCFAQPFGGNNATWYYSILSFFPPYTDSPIQVTSSPDFIFNGDTCRTLSISGGTGCWINSSYIVKESNDSVYYWLPTSNQFVMLYNYNAMVGDTQTIYGMNAMGGDTSMPIVVTSTGTININGFTKRTYTTNHITFPWYFDFGGYIIEDIGSTFFLFPQWGFCDPVIYGIRCYEDSIVGLFNVQPTLSCDTIIWLGVNELEVDQNISISPNPFTSEISIAIQNQNFKQATFTIKNILGQTVFNKQENNIESNYAKTIELNFLSKGIYLIEINIDGERIAKKIVKK